MRRINSHTMVSVTDLETYQEYKIIPSIEVLKKLAKENPESLMSNSQRIAESKRTIKRGKKQNQ